MLLTQIPNVLPKVKVSEDDSQAKYLVDAFVQGTGITLTVVTVDGMKKLQISSSSGGGNMSTSIYDIDINGGVDEAEHIDGGLFTD
jgi:hypothetical protein